MEKLSIEDTKKMFIFVSKKMIESTDVLTKADQAIGDGDHGVNMARGFRAVKEKLENIDYITLGELLNSIGMTLLSSVGGAAGAIFGSFFRGAAKNLDYNAILSSESLSKLLKDGLLEVLNRGKAQEGDKTMVDVLFPAATKSGKVLNRPLSEALDQITDAARVGMEKTKEMIAKVGKAKPLGQRSLGHPDPGAISTYLILKFMKEFLKK